MAKWGEGDPRWIVEERPDATNVNNWHWTEKNASAWSKDRIKKLLDNFKILQNNIECTVIDVEVDGEATANNRKGKLIFFYEWKLKMKWRGRFPGNEAEYKGKITIPNLSEENDLDEIEITIEIDDSNSESEKLKTFMYNVGRDKLREQIGIYIKELKQEYSKDLILPKKNEAEIITKETTKINNKTMDLEKMKICSHDQTKTDEKDKVGLKVHTKTLTFNIKFQCRGNEIYEVLTRKEMLTAWTRSEVKVDPKKGGEFILFGGNVYGKFDELVENKKIAQTWRLKTWPSGLFSNVVIEIEEKSDHTELKLKQTGVPENEAEATRNNWDRYYWNSIKRTFGFGSFLV